MDIILTILIFQKDSNCIVQGIYSIYISVVILYQMIILQKTMFPDLGDSPKTVGGVADTRYYSIYISAV